MPEIVQSQPDIEASAALPAITDSERDPFPTILTPEALDEDLETKGRRVMAERLKTPELRALSRAVRAIDEIRSSVTDSVRRRLIKRDIAEGREGVSAEDAPARAALQEKMVGYGEDGADEAVSEGQTHRDLTPYLAGIVRVERGQALMNEAIDRLTERESDEFKERILGGETHVHEIIIGSGPHAQVYVAERLFQDPDHPSLILEAGAHLGGQFAYETEVHELNTKSGPESSDPSENIAGRSGNKNSLGRGALTDSDLHYDAYSAQDKLATAVRVNETLAGRALVNAEVSEVRRNPYAQEDGKAEYIVTFVDPQTGKSYEVTTDRLIWAGGLGRETSSFRDEQSQQIVAEEADKHRNGQEAQVHTLGSFQRQTIDRIRRGELPFEGWGRVAVIGAGDSGSTVGEQLLGYGGNAGLTTRQETNITIDWIGLEQKDEQKFATSLRHRYTKMAGDVPPEGIDPEEYFHRINPIDGRALSLRRTDDGKIEITYGIYERDEEGNNVLEDGQKKFSGTATQIVDHVIMTTGFDKDFAQVVNKRLANSIIRNPETVNASLGQIFESAGSHVFFGPDSFYKELVVDSITVDESSGKKLVNYHLFPRSHGDPIAGQIEDDGSGMRLNYFLSGVKAENPLALELPGGGLSAEYVTDETGEQVAAKYQDTEVYTIGPHAFGDKETAELPTWITQSPGAKSRERRGDKNKISGRVALWTTVPATRDFAKKTSKTDHPVPDLLTPEHPIEKPQPVQLPELTLSLELSSRSVTYDPKKVEASIPIHSTKEDMLILAVSEIGERYHFPETLKEVSLELEFGTEGQVVVSANTSLLESPQYQAMLSELLADQLVQTITWRYLENTPSKKARLVIPLKGGVPRLRNIRMEEV